MTKRITQMALAMEYFATHPNLPIIDDRLLLEPYSSRKERGAMLSLRF